LVSARVINKKTGQIEQVDKNWFNFGYDASTLMGKNDFLVSATFCFNKASDAQTAYAKGRSVEIIRHRNARYPITHTCGSFFRNFHDSEVTQKIAGTNNKMIFVAYYFDKLGIKGELKVGDAVVSHKHANMLVNSGKASSSDLINLARRMQELVKKNFGIIPQPECQLVGFKDWPLL
jgi:UDP-N-acetylmuramate dehydrogenase